VRYMNPAHLTALAKLSPRALHSAQTEFQGDIAQMAQERARPLHSTLRGGWQRAPSDVPITRMANRGSRLLAANQPKLFIPLNRQRNYYAISNATGSVVYLSFGYPVGPTGIVINNNQNFQQMGFACSTDDIWLWGSAAGVFISAFEGVAIDSRERTTWRI
jgi:hypothetical protein